ncbi:hypothetical protein ACIBSW_33605 [Actinoplanes sp. NPDC049668]|uniref:hypothetical protein n=1 Tax=unclassified Actinoplanes TaxID=2626549 RepID=UPI0033A99611
MNSDADQGQGQGQEQSASQRFAALAGLDWTGPSHQQRTEFAAWIAAGNALHAATTAGRTPRAA